MFSQLGMRLTSFSNDDYAVHSIVDWEGLEKILSAAEEAVTTQQKLRTVEGASDMIVQYLKGQESSILPSLIHSLSLCF